MANATFLYLGTDAGLLILTRPGTSKEWNPGRHTLEGQRIGALARGETFPVRLLAATDAGLQRTPNGGRSWESVLGANVSVLAADPGDAEQVFALTNGGLVYRSDDGGENWAQAAPLPADASAVSMTVTAGGEGQPPVVWLGLASGSLLLSRDLGASWVATAGGDVPVTALVPASLASPEVYAASGDAVYLMRAAGQHEQVGSAAPDAIRHLLLLGMVGRTGATALLAATASGTLLHSAEDGSWTALNSAESSGLSSGDYVTALAAHPEYPDRAYLGTAAGVVFETSNRGRRWQRLEVAAGAAVDSLLAAVLK